MHQDFKESYINEQKKRAAEREARLAKIGMGSGSSKPADTAKPAQSRPAGAQATYGRASVQRPASVPARPAQPASRPASATQRPAGQPAPQRPVSSQRPVAAQPAAAQSPVAQPRSAAPQGVSTQRPASAAQAAGQRPAAQTTRPQTPAQTPASVNKETAAPAHATRRQTPAPRKEDELFGGEINQNKSRAMMFALTGKAEDPDNGGDVDIINMGHISAPKRKKEEDKRKKSNVGKYVGRSFGVLGSVLLFVIIAVFATVGTIAYGPSETVRDLLVQSAMQASATKWVPYIFLDADTVDDIINKSEEVVQDIVSMDDYNDPNTNIDEDEWANAKDGMIFETVNGSTFKAYVLLVKDPSRVYVGTSTNDFSNSKAGVNVFQAAERYNAVACINAGEFLDNGGHGSGYAPLGLTYSQGKCVYRDSTPKTFMGFDKNNNLIVREGMTEAEADALGIRDAVCFQNNNTLIQKEGDNIVLSYEDGNAGTSQRTAIGQRADGVVILIVTDGRSASSLGATHNDMIDLMVSYGAVTAGMLDGGSSAMMYYEDYYTKYGYDTSKLDKYQAQGLVNNYKAFTEPRRIPTFFMVAPEEE